MWKLLLFVVPVCFTTPVHAEFTGTVKLACEALLCLSSGSRPSECSPSINYYYDLKSKKFSDTLKKRRNFLNQCPSASQDNNMRELTEAIVNGAGRCDAKTLNSTLTVEKQRQVCSGSDDCYYETYIEISNAMPSYCTAYVYNSYTDQNNRVGATYEGSPENGGRWID